MCNGLNVLRIYRGLHRLYELLGDVGATKTVATEMSHTT